jgi:hypothetical protein
MFGAVDAFGEKEDSNGESLVDSVGGSKTRVQARCLIFA